MIHSLRNHRPGMTLLITVLIAGGVALAAGLSVAMRAIGELDISTSASQSEEAQTAADGCAEKALLRLMRDSSYAGETLASGRASCDINVTADGENRTVTVTATADRWTRGVQARAALTATGVSLRSWALLE